MGVYPVEFEVDAVLRDGTVAQIRPVRPDDKSVLAELFEKTSSESRYFRFFRAKDQLTDAELEYFANVDYERRMAFVVFDDESVVGVARYDVLEDEPHTAEVAFLVADAQQGRGIGTQLLQLLTVHARLNGVSAFQALVLKENAAMLRLFRTSGYSLERTLDLGVYEVRFPTAESQDSMAAEHRREQTAVSASILPFFYPRSVAVIGASDSAGSIGGTLFRNLAGSSYTGDLYPVHPSAQAVDHVPAFASVGEIGAPVDLAFIVVPAAAVLEVAQQCADAGVRAVVVISAGFSETGAGGAEREGQLLRIVRDAGMRMVGPNCMGLLNTDPALQLNGTFAPIFPPAGNVAMSSQSGALGIAILDHARRTGIGISSFVSVGNKADVSGNDLMLYWEEDPSTDVIVLYLESFGNPRRFARLARRIARQKPIVAVKSGRTDAGRRAASSHTGALASGDRAVDALFHQAGVIRTGTLEELFGVTSLLANQPIPAGPRVGIITNAGGPAILAADALDALGLEIPTFTADLSDRLAAGLPSEASVSNPVDMIAGAGPEDFDRVIEAVMNSGEVDAIMAVFVPVSDEAAGTVAGVLRDHASRGSEIPVLSVFMSGRDAASLLADERVRVPAFSFPETASRALAKVTSYGSWRAKDPGARVTPDGFDVPAVRDVVEAVFGRRPEGGWLAAAEVDRVLQATGLRIPRAEVVGSADHAVAVAESFDANTVLKVVSPSALHKSDVGGLALDLQDEREIREAFDAVWHSVDDAEGVLVQEMAPSGHEVLIGMSEDPVFGPLLVFGLGGVYVELLEDVVFRINPITDVDAAHMLDEIKAAPLLSGYRGFPRGDRAALVDALLRVSMLVDEVPELVELDLNPVLVHPPGSGATVVDARMRVVPRTGSAAAELSDIPSVVGRRTLERPRR